TVTVSRTAKRCRIRVGPGGVEVVLPRTAGPDRAEAFLRENAAWVLEQLERVARLGDIRTAPAAALPDTILLRGERVRVHVVEEEARRTGAVTVEGNTLSVRVPQGKRADAERTLLAWLREQARADLTARVAVRGGEMRSRPNRIFIRS